MTDLFDLDADWSSEQQAIAGRVRKMVDEHFLPIIGQHHNDETYPESILPRIRELGLLELVADDAIDPITYGLISRELDRGGSTLRSLVSVQGSLVMGAIKMFGSEAQKQQWLGPLGRLEQFGCFGLTEPDYGSNPAGMQTRAERTADGYRITGSKCWITNGVRASVAVIWAKLDGQVRGFLVETDRPGFEARHMHGKWSFRASETASLYLDGVEVPETALLPGATSLGRALQCLGQARYTIAWGACGAARGCLEETVKYLKERTQFEGKPLASHQIIQYKLAWMAAEITAMELIAKRLGELKAQGRMKPHHVALAKMNNCRKALEVARTCRELLGANGIHNEYHIGRRMVDLETVVTYEGTEHIHALTLGSTITGIKAFS
ncbi:MAG: acyl-CoA dehydrogenase family protein [Candidatus Hydrogenedentes bacterium]|nr:acyl-CoA dehydrogenase family protein [Candidatus Hydrogenedentota bacterium]